MQALKIDRHGPVADLAVREVDTPELGPDEILVEIEAAGINPSDVGSAEGRFTHGRLPRVLGRDFAGKVVQGPDELIGKAVWGSGGDLGILRDGTHADYVVLPASAASVRPGNLTAAQAAAVGVPFVTAWAALVDRGRLQAGEWVVVAGAAGAVGGAAVQIASAMGAHVIALVKDDPKDARVAHDKVEAVAHSEGGNLVDVVRGKTGGAMAHLAINGVGAAIFDPMLASLRDDGRMVIFSIIGGREVKLDLFRLYRAEISLHGVNTAFYDATRCAGILNRLVPLFESGALAPPTVNGEYPLSKAAEAYAASKGQKIVLVPDRLRQA